MTIQRYIVRNISKYDITINDLGVRIPKGQSRDLLDPLYHLDIEGIRRSRAVGVLYYKILKNLLAEENSLAEEIITSDAKAANDAAIIESVVTEPNIITIYTIGSTFTPVLTLYNGQSATVTWTLPGGVISHSLSLNVNWGTAVARTTTLTVSPWSSLQRMNFGYANDEGESTSIEIVPQCNVTSFDRLDLVKHTLGQLYVAYNTNLHYVDIADFISLDTFDGYQSGLQIVNMRNLLSLHSFNSENTGLINLDLSGCPCITYIKAAKNAYNGINFGGVGTLLNQFDSSNTTMYAQLPPATQFPQLSEYIISECNQSGTLDFNSESTSYLTDLNADGNRYTKVDLTDRFSGSTSGHVALQDNKLTEVILTGCTNIIECNVARNYLDQTQVDQVLNQMLVGNKYNGTVDVSGNIAPSTYGDGYIATLIDRGWTVNYDAYFAPDQITDLLVNPGMGATDFHFGWWCNLPPVTYAPEMCALRVEGHWPDNYPNSAVAYFRWTWAELETVRGQIDFDLIDNAIQSANILQENFAFRVMTILQWGVGVPAWLTEAPYSIPGLWMGGGATFWPDYRNEVFQAEFSRFIAALGARYNNHPAIDHVDIGPVGCWGEWNTACFGEPVDIISIYDPQTEEETQAIIEAYKSIIDMFFDSFPDTPLVMLALGNGVITSLKDIEIFVHALRRGSGWRVDSWSDWGYYSPYWSHQGNLYPTMISNVTAAYPSFPDTWKHAPVQLEIFGTIQNWVDMGWTADAPDGYVYKSFEWALAQHASVLNLKFEAVPNGYLAALEDMLKQNGYRFALDSIYCTQNLTAGDKVKINSIWSNLGVAPSYHNRDLTYKLKSTDFLYEGLPYEVLLSSTADIRTWLPGATNVIDNFTLPTDMPTGTYNLEVAILNRAGTNPITEALPPIYLAIEDRDAYGWYPLLEVSVTGRALVLESIVVTPVDTRVAVESTQQYVAMGYYSGSISKVITNSVAWSSGNSSYVTIGATSGLATGISIGSTIITAILDGVSGHTNIDIVAEVIYSITFTTDGTLCMPSCTVTGSPTIIWRWSDGTTTRGVAPGTKNFGTAAHREHSVSFSDTTSLTAFIIPSTVPYYDWSYFTSFSGLEQFTNLEYIFDMNNASLTSIGSIAGCSKLNHFELKGTGLQADQLDQLYIELDASTGYAIGRVCYTPDRVTSASAAARASLATKGWYIELG